MSKFTSGFWDWIVVGNSEADGSGDDVCEVYALGSGKRAVCENVFAADARLIAAAPALYEALVRLRDLDVNCTQQEDVAAWAQAHAALKAATGE